MLMEQSPRREGCPARTPSSSNLLVLPPALGLCHFVCGRRPVAAAALRRTDQDALSATDKKSSVCLCGGVRARAELKNTCSEQTDISPAAKRRGPQRRRRAVQTTPQRRLPRGDRRRRPPARVRRRKKETAAGAVEPGQRTKGRGREAALRRRPTTDRSGPRKLSSGRARALRVDARTDRRGTQRPHELGGLHVPGQRHGPHGAGRLI